MNRLTMHGLASARCGWRWAMAVAGLGIAWASGAASPAIPQPAWRQVPLHFEQVGPDAQPRFLARSAGLALGLENGDACLWLQPRSDSPLLSARRATVIRFRLVDPEHRPAGEPEGLLPTRIHRFEGRDPGQWRTGLQAHSRVRFPGVYPGVDVVYYGNGGQFEYDFEVAPGADPGRIGFRVDGVDAVELSAEGDLRLRVGIAEVRHLRPVAYQLDQEARREVPARFVQDPAEPNRIGFQLGDYDPGLPLVIDPVVVYAALFGGSEFDLFRRMTVLSSGEIVVVGETASLNMPVENPIETTNIVWVTNVVTNVWGTVASATVLTNYVGTTNHGPAGLPGNREGTDALVARFSADGRTLEFATYLGGSAIDAAMDVAEDIDGSLLIYGLTQSPDFPAVTNGWMRLATTEASVTNQFVVTNQWTFTNQTVVTNRWLVTNSLGDWVLTNHITVETSYAYTNVVYTNAFVHSVRLSTNAWPIPAGWTPVFNSRISGAPWWGYYPFDGFLARLSAAGDQLEFSAFQGGIIDDQGMRVAVGPEGRVYTLLRRGVDSPLLTCLQGDALVYQELLLPPGNVLGLAPQAGGDLWVAGDSTSSRLEETLRWWPPMDPYAPFQPFQRAVEGGRDAYAVHFDPEGVVVGYTYLGGRLDDYAAGLTVTPDGGVRLAGSTSSRDFPTVAALNATNAGGSDVFVSGFDRSLATLEFSTYWGGSADDGAQSIRLGSAGELLVGGGTYSRDIPGAPPPAEGTSATDGDGFVLSLADDGSAELYALLIGGAGDDQVYDLGTDADGYLWVAGASGSGASLVEVYGPSVVSTEWLVRDEGDGSLLFPSRKSGLLAQLYVGRGLEIGLASGNPAVTWPVLLTNYALQSVEVVGATNRWTGVVGSVPEGTNWVYRPSPAAAQEFFQLRRKPALEITPPTGGAAAQ